MVSASSGRPWRRTGTAEKMIVDAHVHAFERPIGLIGRGEVIIEVSKMHLPKWIVNKEVKPKGNMT